MDDRLLWDLHASQHYLYWLAAADQLGLFKALNAAPATPLETAHALKIGVVAAEGLLGVLASLGFLVQYDGRYALTPASRTFLLPTSPFYRGPWLEHVRRRPPVTYEAVYQAFLFDRPIHSDYFGDPGEDSSELGGVVQALHALTSAAAYALAEIGDFARVRRLLDVGGGAGGMSIALATRYPSLQCVVLDQFHVCALASEVIAAHGLSGRVETVAGELFSAPWPSGCDAVLFSHVLDSFGVSQGQHLVRKAYEYLPPGGRLYVHEMLLRDTKDGPLGVAARSLYDHLQLGGHGWTAAELKGMATNVGFAVDSPVPTYGYESILSATKS